MNFALMLTDVLFRLVTFDTGNIASWYSKPFTVRPGNWSFSFELCRDEHLKALAASSLPFDYVNGAMVYGMLKYTFLQFFDDI